MQARRWPGGTGAHRVDAVILTIALLCTKSFDYEALMFRELKDKRGLDLDRVSKVDVIHGRMIVEYPDGKVAVDEPIKDFHGAALKGCDECADFLGRSADISIGSVGSMAGWSSVLVRTEAGRLALDRAREGLDLRDLDNPEALIKLDQLDKRIAVRSLQRKLDPDASSVHRLRRAPERLPRHRSRTGRGEPEDRDMTSCLTSASSPFRTCVEVPRRARRACGMDAARRSCRRRGPAKDFSNDVCLAVWLWEWWRSSLEPAGMDREAFVDVIESYGREIWLWIIGERRWEQCVEGLVGRVERRLPAT